MEKEIIEKLNLFLNRHSPLDEECSVVYLMVEIRKVLDLLNLDRDKYPILRFYCDWSVHIKKDHSKPIQNIVEKIEQSINNGRAFGRQFIPHDLSTFDFVSLIELKKEMEDFFKQVFLPKIIFEDNNWSEFRHLLLRVLADQPIIGPTNNISKVYFCIANKGAAVLMVEFNDGKRYRFVNAF